MDWEGKIKTPPCGKRFVEPKKPFALAMAYAESCFLKEI